MKLYATTTSERASKGQGGNKTMKSIMTVDKMPIVEIEAICNETSGNVSIYVNSLIDENGFKMLVTEQMTKGEQQKGESLKCTDCYKIDPTGQTDCPRHKK